MSIARTRGAVVVGVDGRLVEVEADVGPGLPVMTIVGLPDAAVAESRDRARAAVLNSRCEWPVRKVTVGRSPASLPRRGSGLDAAIAVAVLAATGQVPPPAAAAPLIVGELGLDGQLRGVRGMVAAALAARRHGIDHLIVPAADAGEAALVLVERRSVCADAGAAVVVVGGDDGMPQGWEQTAAAGGRVAGDHAGRLSGPLRCPVLPVVVLVSGGSWWPGATCSSLTRVSMMRLVWMGRRGGCRGSGT